MRWIILVLFCFLISCNWPQEPEIISEIMGATPIPKIEALPYDSLIQGDK